jgi:NAD+ kinase
MQARQGAAINRMNIQKVLIVTKPKQADVADVAEDLRAWFKKKGITATLESEAASSADLTVVVGGDGTLLAAARLLADRQVPIVAINYGGLGFLTEVTRDEMHAALEGVLSGRFITEERMMMDIRVSHDNQPAASYRALNDVVITKARGTISRMIELEARVDGQYLSRFRADGLIVSTPTGSTAYNLSAGGPIIFPTMTAMVVTPICSHTLTNRPIVLSGNVRIEIVLRSEHDDVYVTVDGQVGVPLRMDDHLTIEKSSVAVKLVAPADKNYFDVLRGKLKWG